MKVLTAIVVLTLSGLIGTACQSNDELTKNALADAEKQVIDLDAELADSRQQAILLEAQIQDARKLAAVIEYYLAAVDLRFNGQDVTAILETLSETAEGYGDPELAALAKELQILAGTSFGGEVETRFARRLRLILETTLVEM